MAQATDSITTNGEVSRVHGMAFDADRSASNVALRVRGPATLPELLSRMRLRFFGALLITIAMTACAALAESYASLNAEKPSAPDPEVSTAWREPSGAVTLNETCALALLQNPELKAFAWEVRAKEARVLQARLRINPELTVEIEDVRWKEGPGTQSRSVGWQNDSIQAGAPNGTGGGNSSTLQIPRLRPSADIGRESGAHSGFAEAQFTAILSKEIELGGKRAGRIHVARRDVDVAAWDYEVARANVLTEVGQAFVAVIGGQQRIRLDQELLALATQVADSISKLVDAGEVSAIELSKAQTALAMSEIALAKSQHDLQGQRARLAATWGGTEAHFERAEGELMEVRSVPALEGLVARVEQNPDLARWASEIDRRSATVRLERANRIPNVTVFAGLRTRGLESRSSDRLLLGPGTSWEFSRSALEPDRSSDNSLYFSVSLPLPVLNRNQGAILEAQREVSKAGEEQRASEVRVRSSLTQAYHALQALYTTATSLSTKVIPNAVHTFESVKKGYEQGEFGYIDVLDAQRTLFEARNQYLDALVAFHQNVTQVERLTGSPLWNYGTN